MSRSRNIKPGFFKNDLLAECPALARLLFAALWCEADREGRLEDRPKRIKAACLPYDECDIDALLSSLHQKGFIVRYVVDGIGYIAIPEFLSHQKPHMKEAASTIPAPDKHQPRNVLAPESPERAALIPDSLNLIPDSPSKDTVQPAAARSRFDDFWDVYPNKKGKESARKTWQRRKLDPVADNLIAHVRLMLDRDDGWRRGFIPMGSTYLNQARWEDEPTGTPVDRPVNGNASAPSKTLTAIQKLQAMKNGQVDSERDHGRVEQAALPGT